MTLIQFNIIHEYVFHYYVRNVLQLPLKKEKYLYSNKSVKFYLFFFQIMEKNKIK